MDISYKVKSGKNVGSIFKPHKHECGRYVVSKTRFKIDYIYVNTYSEIKTYLDKGFKVRVSDPRNRKSPSLVRKDSLAVSHA